MVGLKLCEIKCELDMNVFILKHNLFSIEFSLNKWLAHFYGKKTQGRIQGLSEGGARFISKQKHPDLGTNLFKIDIFAVFTRFSFS